MKSNFLHQWMICLVIGFAVCNAQAQDKLLGPAYQIGKSYQMVTTQNMEMDMAAIGAALGGGQAGGKMVTEMKIVVDIECAKHTTPGHKKVTSKVSSIKMNMDSMGMKLEYDSTQPGSENSPLGAQMGALVGSETVMIFDENEKVIDVKGLENLGAQGGIGAEQLKQMSNPAAQLGIPEAGVSVGEKWDNSFEMNLGNNMGEMKTDLKMDYAKDEGSNAVVNFKGGVKMDIQGAAEGQAPAPEMKNDSTMAGWMKIDKTNRFVTSGETQMKMKISMPNPVNPQQKLDIPATIKQSYAGTVK